ncbi:MAG: twin-arginine translocase TatA/TatE family subunit [Bacteroidetes bacterium]|nr:twin-arginine translocase TatA/TatE family subunit [Bacteroidota bacterium]
MFEGLFQPQHLILILIIVLVVMGPRRLPEIGGALGKSIREFRRSTSGELDTENATGAASAGPHAASKAAEPQDAPRPAGAEPPPASASNASNVCGTCHALNSPANKFCGQCGARLG